MVGGWMTTTVTWCPAMVISPWDTCGGAGPVAVAAEERGRRRLAQRVGEHGGDVAVERDDAVLAELRLRRHGAGVVVGLQWWGRGDLRAGCLLAVLGVVGCRRLADPAVSAPPGDPAARCPVSGVRCGPEALRACTREYRGAVGDEAAAGVDDRAAGAGPAQGVGQLGRTEIGVRERVQVSADQFAQRAVTQSHLAGGLCPRRGWPPVVGVGLMAGCRGRWRVRRRGGPGWPGREVVWCAPCLLRMLGCRRRGRLVAARLRRVGAAGVAGHGKARVLVAGTGRRMGCRRSGGVRSSATPPG